MRGLNPARRIQPSIQHLARLRNTLQVGEQTLQKLR